jgi:5'(3')-deoxyribonucleotidase
MPDAHRVLDRLQSRYDIFIASAAMEVPTSFTAKFEWLAKHFPFIPTSHIVFCGDKSILRADYLIDDNTRQLELFQASRNGEISREGILYTSPANIDVTTYRRVNNWQDVEKMFLD